MLQHKRATKILLCLLIALPAFAKALADAKQWSTAVNISGRQRMLTQKMTKEVLQLQMDPNNFEYRENLAESQQLFNKSLSSLVKGDPRMGLPSIEDYADLAHRLQVVQALWQQFNAHVQSVLDSVDNAQPIKADDIQFVLNKNQQLLSESNTAVKLYEQNAHGNSDATLFKLVNIAGRQRMLTQKMSHQYLYLLTDYSAPAKMNLAKTHKLFDESLAKIEQDLGSAKISDSNKSIIVAQLATVKQLWAPFSGLIQAAQTSQPTQEQAQQIIDTNIPLLKAMNKAVKMLERAG